MPEVSSSIPSSSTLAVILLRIFGYTNVNIARGIPSTSSSKTSGNHYTSTLLQAFRNLYILTSKPNETLHVKPFIYYLFTLLVL